MNDLPPAVSPSDVLPDVIAHEAFSLSQTGELYLVFEYAGLRIGTCEHCVVEEHMRPARATEALGDEALDFERDWLLSELSRLGITLHITQEYVCP